MASLHHQTSQAGGLHSLPLALYFPFILDASYSHEFTLTMSHFISDSACWLLPLLTLNPYWNNIFYCLAQLPILLPILYLLFSVASAYCFPVCPWALSSLYYLCFCIQTLQDSIWLIGPSFFSTNCQIGHICFVRLAHRLTLGQPLFWLLLVMEISGLFSDWHYIRTGSFLNKA